MRDDPDNGVLEQQLDNFTELSETDHKWTCPHCGVHFGRSSLIHGLPAIKLVGGKTRRAVALFQHVAMFGRSEY